MVVFKKHGFIMISTPGD